MGGFELSLQIKCPSFYFTLEVLFFIEKFLFNIASQTAVSINSCAEELSGRLSFFNKLHENCPRFLLWTGASQQWRRFWQLLANKYTKILRPLLVLRAIIIENNMNGYM